MGLASGAHVKLGSYEYMIAEGVDGHYNHRFEYPTPEDVEIAGDPGKRTMRKRRMFWTLTDWSGGEGRINWDARDPSVYNYADGLNPRIVDQITGKPKRSQVQVTATTNGGSDRCFLISAAGYLCLLGSASVSFSSDHGVNWTTRTSAANTLIDVGDKVTAVAADDEKVYYATKGGANTREIIRMDVRAEADSAGTGASVVQTRNTAVKPIRGMAVMNGRLYTFDGRKLHEWDIETAGNLFADDDLQREVFNTGVVQGDGKFGGAEPGSWWADAVATENSVIFFYGSEGYTQVYEYKKNRGYPLWRLPMGFTCKSLTVQNGIVYAAGHFVGDGTTVNGYGALYAMPLDSRREIFIGYIRKQLDQHMTIQEMANSWGYQIMFANARIGRVYVYDAEYDAISVLDDFNIAPAPTEWTTTGEKNNDTTKIGALLTHGNRRYAAFYKPGDATYDFYQVLAWQPDELTNRESVGSLSNIVEMGEWDYDFPMDAKTLISFVVTYKVEDTNTISGLLDHQRILIYYSIDGGSYVLAGTVDDSTTPAQVKGRVRVAAPTGTSSVQFMRMKIKMVLDNEATTGVKQPVVYGLTAEAELVARNEYWELILRTGREPNTNARPRRRQYAGSQIRDYLEDLAQTKDSFTFLDGYRYDLLHDSSTATTGTQGYTSHTVVIEEWEDQIQTQGEGYTRVKLRSVDDA